MSNILVVGGPHTGNEVEDEGPTKIAMVMAQDPNNPLIPPVALPTKYVRRGVVGQIGERKLIRNVYVHESIQNPMELAQLLANILIGKWIEEGGEIVEEEVRPSGEAPEMVPSGSEGRTPPVGPQPSRTAGGLYLP